MGSHKWGTSALSFSIFHFSITWRITNLTSIRVKPPMVTPELSNEAKNNGNSSNRIPKFAEQYWTAVVLLHNLIGTEYSKFTVRVRFCIVPRGRFLLSPNQIHPHERAAHWIVREIWIVACTKCGLTPCASAYCSPIVLKQTSFEPNAIWPSILKVANLWLWTILCAFRDKFLLSGKTKGQWIGNRW